MADKTDAKAFPDVSSKLTAPTKKSLFERQKAEADAKRKKEDAETAAVYEDFLKSFDEEGGGGGGGGSRQRHDGFGQGAIPPAGPQGLRGGGGTSRRHFTPSTTLKGGPGSLGSGPPPSMLSRKRNLDGTGRPRENKGLAMLEEAANLKDAKIAFGADDEIDEEMAEEKATPKPTVHLSKLPPTTSVAVIKALMPANISVDGVRFVPPSANRGERQHAAAIVTLAKDTPASEIDAAVATLQNKYLGHGYNLSITRHLSSAIVHSAGPLSLSSLSTQPFGAKAAAGPEFQTNRPPPLMNQQGRFAPPASFNPYRDRGKQPLQVLINPPTDIRQLKLIHKTAEAVIQHGPAFEVLLMSRPSIQRDERWSWLWNARSTAGVWYRWRLWEMMSGSATDGASRIAASAPPQVFDEGAPWLPPDRNLPFEFTTAFEEFVSDRDYDSSEEEESGDETAQQPGVQRHGAEYLNPLKRAKFTHLLSRLPKTTVRLRKGDVARITAFAISNSGRGVEEVVKMLIDNIERPFTFTSANPNKHDSKHDSDEDMEKNDDTDKKEKEDQTSSKLIALYLLSDLLSSSSTSGVRHAWRYRQLFEAQLQSRSIFKKLGEVEREMGWGRLKAEKWRRAVSGVLHIWEGWSVFSTTAQENMQRDFIDSADAKVEKLEAEERKKREEQEKKKSAWKTVDAQNQEKDNSSVEEEDLDGEPMEDEDLDGVPMENSDLDGEAMEEDVVGEPMDEDAGPAPVQVSEATVVSADPLVNTKAVEARRKRPRAIDMFGDSE